MTLEDWHQALEVDPILSLVITRLRDGTLGKGQSKATDPPKVSQHRWECNHLLLKQVSCTDGPGPENQRRPSFSWSYQLHRGRLLSEDAMIRLAIWAWSACLVSCDPGSPGLAWLPRQRRTLGSAAHAMPLKASSPKPPSKTSWPHILYSWSTSITCAWNLGKGLDENVLVVTDHFTRYTQVYVTRTQTAQTTAKTLWNKFIVHYGLPKKILMDQG